MLQFFKKYSQTSIEKTKSEYKRPTRIAIKLLSMDFQRIISPLSLSITHPNMIPASEHTHRLASCPRFAFYLIEWRRLREKSDRLVPRKTVSSFHNISIFQDHCSLLSSTQLTVLFEIIMTRLISSKLFWHDISRKVVSISSVYPHNYYVYVIHKIKSSLVQSEEFLFLFKSRKNACALHMRGVAFNSRTL